MTGRWGCLGAWFFLFSAGLFPLQGQTNTAERVIRVGVLNDNYPHSFIGGENKSAGYAVEILAAVERTMGLKIHRVIGNTQVINAAFKAGELDMLQTLAESSERDKTMDFSLPIITMSGGVFARKDSPVIARLEDLRGKKILLHAGSLGEQLVVAAGLSNCIVHVVSVEDALIKLDAGIGDATIATKITGGMLVANLSLHNLTCFEGALPGFQVRYCFAVQEGDKELLAKLNEGLAQIARTGESERIYRKWFNQVDPQGYTAFQITLAIASGLAVALLAAVWGVVRQAKLSRHIGQQAQQLQKSEEEYRGIFELSFFGLLLVSRSAEGLLLERINPVALRLLGKNEAAPARGALLSQVFPEEQALWKRINEDYDLAAADEFEYARPGRSGAAWLRVAASHVGPQLQIVLADITAAKSAEETLRLHEQQLRQSQKLEAIGTLSSGIAHDFNNILTSIVGNCELIRMEQPKESLVVESNEEIQRAAERARNLVRQILSFSRQSGTQLEVLEVTNVVKESIRFLRSTTPSTIEIHHRPEAPGTFIEADSTQIHQVLMNLGTNAAHAMRGQTGVLEFVEERIRVTSEMVAQQPQLQVGDHLRIAVRDNGRGMTAEVVQRIFEPFFTTKSPGEGTGLGLSVVHGIVKSHRGAVCVYSEPGKGTVFHLYFPVTNQGCGKSFETEFKSLTPGRGERILMVDDEEAIRRLVEQALQRLGYRVASYGDPQLALQAFQRESKTFDLVLSDLTMPHLNGLEFIAQIRALRPEIPVILASGFLNPADQARAQALRVNQVLEKPMKLQKLAEAITVSLKSAV